MIYQATVSSIAALGGIRPGSHITARPVTAIKAGPVAHYFGRVPCCHRMVVGSDKLAMRQPCLTLTGQRSYTDERRAETQHTATSRSGGGNGLWPATAPCKSSPLYRRNLGNPCAEKVRPHRARQSFRHLASARSKTVLRVISAADRPLTGNLIMARKKLAV